MPSIKQALDTEDAEDVLAMSLPQFTAQQTIVTRRGKDCQGLLNFHRASEAEASSLSLSCFTWQVKLVRLHDGPQLEVLAEASAGSDVSSLTWYTSDILLVGSSGNSELQFWRLDSASGLIGSTSPFWAAILAQLALRLDGKEAWSIGPELY